MIEEQCSDVHITLKVDYGDCPQCKHANSLQLVGIFDDCEYAGIDYDKPTLEYIECIDCGYRQF